MYLFPPIGYERAADYAQMDGSDSLTNKANVKVAATVQHWTTKKLRELLFYIMTIHSSFPYYDRRQFWRNMTKLSISTSMLLLYLLAYNNLLYSSMLRSALRLTWKKPNRRSIAQSMADNSLLKFSCKEYFLKAGLCVLCTGDAAEAKIKHERFEGQAAIFRDSRESKLLCAVIEVCVHWFT